MEPDATTLLPDELLAHADWVRALAVRLVRDRDAAEDLVQETWLAALRRPPARDRSPRPWLARVMRNFAYARGAARSSRAWHHDERTRLDGTELTPDELLEHVDAQRLVAATLVQLPEPFRTTVLQRYYQGLTSAEIARRADIPAGTVRWRLKRGLDLMRAELDERQESRAAWTALLLPLCERAPAPLATGAAGILGDLGLSLAGRALAVLVCATGLLLGAWQLTRPAPELERQAALASDADERAPAPRARLAETSSGESAASPAATVRRSASPAQAPVRTEQSERPGARAADAPVHIRARVVDVDGAPLAHAALEVAHAGATQVAHARSDGSLELRMQDLRRARQARLVVRAAGSACQIFAPSLVPGEDVDLGTLTLAPAAELTGVVLDALGAPLAGVEVSALPARAFDAALDPTRLPACARTTRTDDLGMFVLPCVPLGAMRVAAFPPHAAPIASAVLDLTPGVEIRPLELRAGRVERRQIVGRVLGPDGSPARNARLAWRVVGEDGSRRDVRRDAEQPGAFRFDAPHDTARVELRAWSADGTLCAGPLAATAGGPAVTLRLTRAAQTRLAVRDAASGRPLEEVEVRVRDDDWDLTLLERRRSGGRIDVPRSGDELSVGARGYASLDLDMPSADTLELELAPHGLVSGVVVDAEGAPVPRATVALYRRTDADGSFQLHGLPLDRARHPSAVDRTDRKGRFELATRDTGPFVLRVERKGQVPAELVDLLVDPIDGAQGLRVAFGPGGDVRGEVRLPDGASATGLWVAATRGDHAPRATLVDDDDRFRFEGLMPGPWSFTIVPGPLPTRATSITEFGRGFEPLDDPLPELTTTRIEPAGLARVVLLPRGPDARALRGRLRITGGPTLLWTARRGEQGAPRALDDDGRFELAATGTDGEVLLVGVDPDGARLELRIPAERQTPEQLDLELDLGALSGHAQALGFASGALAYEWESPDGVRARAPVHIDEHGAFRLALAPAGAGRLVDESDGRVLAEVDVPAGGHATIELR